MLAANRLGGRVGLASWRETEQGAVTVLHQPLTQKLPYPGIDLWSRFHFPHDNCPEEDLPARIRLALAGTLPRLNLR